MRGCCVFPAALSPKLCTKPETMLTGQNIVYFGDAWHGLMRNRHNILSILARHNRVFFIERRPHLRPTLQAFRQGELTLKDVWRSSIRKVSENLYVFRYPLWAPVSGRFPLKPITRTIQNIHLQAALRQLKLTQPIVFFYHPEWLDWVEAIPSPKVRLYHVVDDYTSYQGVPEARRGLIAERERCLLAQVDAVFVVSPALYEAKCRFHERVHLIPNGVNYEAYTEALRDPDLPTEVRHLPPPRIGYSGLIGDKLELEMLRELAQINAGWSFVFLGAVNAARKADTWQAMRALPNVHYLAEIPWERVPHYLKGLDVGLMPYVQDGHAATISPLKLYDYLAAGLPIAALDIPAVHEFASLVSIAEHPADFQQALQVALRDNSLERREARRAVASQHSWGARVEQFSTVIEGLL